MGLLDLLGFGNKSEKITEFLAKGAIIIDVRTPAEYANGHIKGSKNVPLNLITSQMEILKKMEKPIIACCASGMRSAQATSILKSNGIETLTGGGLQSLAKQL
jgi:rhodanese-related sulfurtransferase